MSTYSPFVGSRPFSPAERAILHGRSEDTAALSKLWQRHRLTVLHGPAGVGKTSLLRAGVLPELGENPTADILPVGRLACPADFPLAALPELNPFTFALLASWYPDESPTRISGSSIRGLIRKNLRTDRYGAPVPILAAIDHADLLFWAADRQSRRFIDELVAASTTQDNLHLLITVRAENHDELLALLLRAGLPTGFIARFPLHAFDPAGARQAVSGPLEGRSHPLATSAEQLVEDLQAGGHEIDPALLQIVCNRLWDELPPGGDSEIEKLPDVVDQILGDHCLQVLATVAGQHGEWPSVLTNWLRHAFCDPDSVAGIPEEPGATRGLPNTVLRALVDAHLLRVEEHSDRRRYHLRHARLRPVVECLDPRMATATRQNRPRLETAEAACAAGQLKLARHLTETVHKAADDRRIHAAAECLLGTIACRQGRIETAIEHYETATRAFGALGDTTHVGMLLAAVGQLKIGDSTPEAVNRLHAALTQLPGDLFVKTALAQALWYAGRTQAAIAVLDDALSQDGSTPEALRLRGELLADLDRAEPALRDLDRVDYADRPSSRAAWVLAKQTCAGGGSPSIEEELEMVADAGDSGPVLLRVARVLRLEGDAEAAADLAKRAVQARQPPLPQHLHKEAERLMTR